MRQVSFAHPGQQVLDAVDLRVPAGELAVVTGPSGVGKTTLLHVISGDELPAGGSVVLSGHVLADERTDVRPDRRPVALVPQGGGLDPRKNIGANIALGLPKRQRVLRTGAARVAAAFDLVGLDNPMADRLPRALSVGERQRVALARGLVQEPELLLLDEPFFSLDAFTRERLVEQVREVLARTQTTTIMVTHDETEAAEMGDSLYRLAAGRLERLR